MIGTTPETAMRFVAFLVEGLKVGGLDQTTLWFLAVVMPVVMVACLIRTPLASRRRLRWLVVLPPFWIGVGLGVWGDAVMGWHRG